MVTARTSSRRPRIAAFAAAIAVAFALAGGGVARAAATLSAQVRETEIADGETFDLHLRASGDPSEAPDVSALRRDFEIVGTRQGSRISVINGRAESSLEWVLTLAPRTTGDLTIPSIRAGDAATDPIHIKVLAAGADSNAGSPGANGAGSPARVGAGAAGSGAAGSGAAGSGTTGSGTTGSGTTGSGTANAGGNPDLFVKATVSDEKPFVQGEVRYLVQVYDGIGMSQGALTEPSAENARFTPLGEVRTYEKTVGDRRYRVHEREYALSPQASGTLTIPPVTLQARVPAPRPQGRPGSARGGFFDDAFDDEDFFGGDPFARFGAGAFASARAMLDSMMDRGREVRVRSNPVTLEVQARPADAKDGWFLPATRVELEESWSPAEPRFRVGEAVTRTVVLRALGASAEQLPRFPIPSADGVKQYPEDTHDATAPSPDGTMAVLEQSVSLLPTSAGTFTLPPIEVRWFDIEAKEVRVARLPAKTIDVAAAPGAEVAGGKAEPAPGAAKAARAQTSQGSQTSQTSQAPAIPGSSNTAGTPVSPGSSPADPGAIDAVPPSVAAWLRPGLIALGAAAALLVVYAVSLTLRRRRAAAAPPPLRATNAATTPSGANVKHLLEELRQACRADDPRAARSALVAWARATWPDAPPTNGAQLARRLGGHAGLSRAMTDLDVHLYGRDASRAWSGDGFWRELTAARSSVGIDDKSGSSVLPALYPETRAA